MHIRRSELRPVAGNEGETVLTYPTDQQPDVQSLERFQIRTLLVRCRVGKWERLALQRSNPRWCAAWG